MLSAMVEESVHPLGSNDIEPCTDQPSGSELKLELSSVDLEQSVKVECQDKVDSGAVQEVLQHSGEQLEAAAATHEPSGTALPSDAEQLARGVVAGTDVKTEPETDEHEANSVALGDAKQIEKKETADRRSKTEPEAREDDAELTPPDEEIERRGAPRAKRRARPQDEPFDAEASKARLQELEDIHAKLQKSGTDKEGRTRKGKKNKADAAEEDRGRRKKHKVGEPKKGKRERKELRVKKAERRRKGGGRRRARSKASDYSSSYSYSSHSRRKSSRRRRSDVKALREWARASVKSAAAAAAWGWQGGGMMPGGPPGWGGGAYGAPPQGSAGWPWGWPGGSEGVAPGFPGDGRTPGRPVVVGEKPDLDAPPAAIAGTNAEVGSADGGPPASVLRQQADYSDL